MVNINPREDAKRDGKVRGIGTARPFASSAMDYLAKGWKPMPLPAKAKSEPPTGYTGWENPSSKINKTKVQQWLDKGRKEDTRNVCIRPNEDMFILDVDAYKAKESLANMAKDIGHELNPTWVNSARADGISGHYVYRVPPGLSWPSKAAPGIETLHFGHRYLVASPSVHPDIDDPDSDADYYRWYAPGKAPNGNGTFEIPDWDDIPEMDPDWVDYISSGQGARHFPEKKLPGRFNQKLGSASDWVEEHDGEPCGIMLRAVRKFQEHAKDPGIHDTAREALFSVLQLAGEGHRGLAEVVPLIRDGFLEERLSDAGSARHSSTDDPMNSWNRMFLGGVAKTMFREEEGEFLGMSCQCAALGADGEPVPEINVKSYKLSDEIPRCYTALQNGTEDGDIYLSSGIISLYTGSKLHPLQRASLRVELDKVVRFYVNIRSEDGPAIKGPASPPDHLVDSVLHSPARWKSLDILDRIARTPFYARSDGKVVLVAENGYHAAHATYVDIDEKMLSAMGQVKVTPERLDRSIQLIMDELLHDFPFVEPADRVSILAALLLPFIRELIDGPTPLHFIDAPSPRSGKSLLANAISAIVVGPDTSGMSLMTAPSNSAEWGKKLLATLLNLPSMIVLDNVNGKLHSDALASVLTTTTMSERVLGKSEMGSPANNCLWVGTGNNLAASDEIARRIVPCRIDAGVESPHARTGFKHPDLLGWARANRHKIVWALCTLVANWVELGEPDGRVRLGGFESWACVVGGILEAAGIEGLLSNQARFLDAAEEEIEVIVDFVRTWKDWEGVGKANHKTSAEFEAMPGLLDLVDISRSTVSRAVGNYLRKYRGRIILGHKIELHGVHGTRFWYLEPVDETTKSASANRSRYKVRVSQGSKKALGSLSR